jgi:hypothetical protein
MMAVPPKIGNHILLEPPGLKVYPNPFRTSVNFAFVPERDVQTRLELFDNDKVTAG